MPFFKKLFGRAGNGKTATTVPSECYWIAPEENPWKQAIVDLRPFTQSMLSSSPDPQMAENAISYSGEDGTAFYGIKPIKTKETEGKITFTIDKRLEPGVLFTPDTMEHKWAIYFDGANLIFIRSWLREVVAIARTSQRQNLLIIESITGEFSSDESPDFTNATLNAILATHVLKDHVPCPLPADLKDDLKQAALWAFSVYGKMAHFGTFDLNLYPTSDLALRTHSLLHIAVARGDSDAIHKQIRKGVNPDCLAGDGLAPLHWAIACENNTIISILIDAGANPNVKSLEGATALMNAVQSNKIEKLDLLVAAGAEINTQDNRGFTALHRAAEMGLTVITQRLLELGADKRISAQGYTALQLAQLSKHQAIINLLI